MIEAECHTDDLVVDATFDATAWFEQASDTDIIRLAQCGFGGDCAADEVAIWMRDENDDVADVFTYMRIVNRKRTENYIGFECCANKNQALEWITKNTPDILESVKKGVGEYAN